MNMFGMADDIPPQALEPLRTVSQCGNCAFAERDGDDGKLYCHEGSVKGHPVVIMRAPQEKPPVLASISARPQPKPEIEVLGVVGFWPEVQPQWSCWQHPDRQAERRRLECGGLAK